MTPKTEYLNHKKDKEAVIFEAACRIFREKGFHQARMADIAQVAGISYGLVYHYYKSKSDLFDALMDEWWTSLDMQIDELLKNSLSVDARLGGIADFFLDQYQKRPDLVHIFITEYSRSSTNLTQERLDRIKGLMSRTEEIIRRGQAEGAIRPDLKSRYLTNFFLGSLEALLSTMVLENQPLKSQSHKTRLVDAILTMFFEGARPGQAGPQN